MSTDTITTPFEGRNIHLGRRVIDGDIVLQLISDDGAQVDNPTDEETIMIRKVLVAAGLSVHGQRKPNIKGPYTRLYGNEQHGFDGSSFGLRIEVAGTNLPDPDSIYIATYQAAKMVSDAILAERLRLDPAAQERAKNQREALLACFPERIYVEEIPNGYCSDYCCRHLPWFIVTTTRGRIKIGWRKRVISIDWSECPDTGYANHLFSGEDVTMGERDIHAWNYIKAANYIDTVLSSYAHPEP
jgi:hypothetical protein